MRRRERARRISHRGVSRQQESLAAAASEIFAAAIATAARLGHPVFATKVEERGRFLPDPVERLFPHVLKRQARQYFRGMAGKYLACGIDQHQSSSPSSHAGLGILRVVIWHNGIDADPPRKPL